jgi:hypothetical protein
MTKPHCVKHPNVELVCPACVASITSKARAAAARRNGKEGGRPAKYPPCPKYRRASGEAGSHRFNAEGRCFGCGYVRKVNRA